MRCRLGPLRVERSLRDVCSGFAVGLPLVGAKFTFAINGSANRREYVPAI